jgi:2-hydroxycyclohexanecarboxyl-CoA dehydrogenase
MDQKDRVALITGAGQGIGRTMAIAFAAAGANVAVNDINAKAVGETVDAIRRVGGRASPAQCDITDLTAVRAMVGKVEAEFGRIDVLVNNAALLIAHEMFVDTNPDDCDREIKVVLYGTMNCTRAVLPGMIARKSGKIVNIATDAARVGQERQCNYSAAKGGVISFTKSIAKEVGRDNINVNAVSPGATNSPMRQEMLRQLTEKIGTEKAAEREEKVKRAYALRRIGEPDDISNTVMFLSSESARHITGQILSVNGGFAMPG